ncbi:hypothetical protein GE09DRAFT_197846 [Coniochaeta sp. 2T2.1]|nr:hypothetical protein GE09DRAFT_197846 [Coniochaeta sp. 2T2.1]
MPDPDTMHASPILEKRQYKAANRARPHIWSFASIEEKDFRRGPLASPFFSLFPLAQPCSRSLNFDTSPVPVSTCVMDRTPLVADGKLLHCVDRARVRTLACSSPPAFEEEKTNTVTQGSMHPPQTKFHHILRFGTLRRSIKTSFHGNIINSPWPAVPDRSSTANCLPSAMSLSGRHHRRNLRTTSCFRTSTPSPCSVRHISNLDCV